MINYVDSLNSLLDNRVPIVSVDTSTVRCKTENAVT